LKSETKRSLSTEGVDAFCTFLRFFADELTVFSSLHAELERNRRICRVTNNKNLLQHVRRTMRNVLVSIPVPVLIAASDRATRKWGEMDPEGLRILYRDIYGVNPVKVIQKLAPTDSDTDVSLRKATMCDWIRSRNMKRAALLLDAMERHWNLPMNEIEQRCASEDVSPICSVLQQHPCLLRIAPHHCYAPSGTGAQIAKHHFEKYSLRAKNQKYRGVG
jgi:hypothetical protein